jgi:hypothetical protein
MELEQGRCEHFFPRLVATLMATAIVACSSRDRATPAVDSSRAAAAAPATAAVRTPEVPLRAAPGERGHVAADAITWDANVVAAHLSGIGLRVEGVGVVTRPMFRVAGQRYHLQGGRAMVEAFFYGDANAVALDADRLDSVQVAPRGGRMQWEMAPRLVVDNNMAAVIVTDDAALRAKIESALRSRLRGSSAVR